MKYSDVQLKKEVSLKKKIARAILWMMGFAFGFGIGWMFWSMYETNPTVFLWIMGCLGGVFVVMGLLAWAIQNS